jgi:hypothetical protein
MKRKLKWLAIVLVVLLLGFGTALFLWPRDRITAESYEQICIGMTEKEVEDILGSSGLPWDEFVAKRDDTGIIHIEDILGSGYAKRWLGRHGMIIVVFDQEGRHVGWKSFQRWRSGFWDGLRDWLGL